MPRQIDPIPVPVPLKLPEFGSLQRCDSLGQRILLTRETLDEISPPHRAEQLLLDQSTSQIPPREIVAFELELDRLLRDKAVAPQEQTGQ